MSYTFGNSEERRPSLHTSQHAFLGRALAITISAFAVVTALCSPPAAAFSILPDPSGIDPDDAPPVIADQTFHVRADAAAGAVVGTVMASDGDGPQPLSYSIETGDADGMFVIDPATGQISVAVPSGLSSQGQRAMGIAVSDGVRASSATASVVVDPVHSGEVAYVGGSGGGVVSVIDTASANVVNEIPVPLETRGLAVDGVRHRLYAAAFDYAGSGVTVIDTVSDAVIGNIPVGQSEFLALSGDGSKLYVSQPVGMFSVVDTSTFAAHTLYTGGANNPWQIAVNALTGKVYTSNFDPSGGVFVMDIDAQGVLSTLPTGARPTAIALSPDGGRLYVRSGWSSSQLVSVFSTASGSLIGSVAAGEGSCNIALSADGARAYVSDIRDRVVSVLDTASLQVVAEVTGFDSAPGCIALTADGTHALVTEPNGRRVTRFDTGTLHIDASTPTSNAPYFIVIAGLSRVLEPDGRGGNDPIFADGFDVATMQ